MVRVDLLPQESKERKRATRRRGWIIACFVVLVTVLAGLSLMQEGRLTAAEARLAEEEATLASLRSREGTLVEFADLERQVAAAREMVPQALGDEMTVAGLLQDLASVMPVDAQLESLALTFEQEQPADAGATVGSLVLTGRSVNEHAPGLERLLLELEKVAAVREVHVNTSALESLDATQAEFVIELRLGDELRTDRYVDGLPEDLR